MNYLTLILILIIILLVLIVWNLLRKNEKQEDILASYLLYMDNLSKIVEHSADRLNKIDTKGSFKSDDEIGWFFEQILQIQGRLNKFRLIKLEDGEEKKTEEK
jgi:cbb3-type cytochrome oxidase subunit 3